MRHARPLVSAVFIALLAGCQNDRKAEFPSGKSSGDGAAPSGHVEAGRLQAVHEFSGPMPTGVSVSHDGRVFVNYPRWEDPIQFTVAEIKDGKEVPFPSREANGDQNADQLFSVQSVVVDPRNRLWALDTGNVNMESMKGLEWAKLVCIDLQSNRIVKTIRFPQGVITEKSYLNDVRFDLRRGAEGTAYITDSSGQGDNGIVVVDLASGRSWRKLHQRPEVKADPSFTAVLEGQPLMIRKPGQPPQPAKVGSDGIAISHDGSRLFFCPLASRDLFSVSTDALANEEATDEQVLATLKRESRTFASDGLESDAAGRIYLTDWEHNAIWVRSPDGAYSKLISDERMWWPDTLSLGTNGYLYFTANQLHRQAKFHNGQDKRQKPYHLFRVKVGGAKPVLLR